MSRSTYYKHFSSDVACGVKENQEISRFILKIYADCDKRLGTYKIAHLLHRDYGIKISVGRVYRLMKNLKLPRMSTDKPFQSYKLRENAEECPNHLKQNFNPKAPNIVWNISTKPDGALVKSTFQKAYESRNFPKKLMRNTVPRDSFQEILRHCWSSTIVFEKRLPF